MGVADDSAADDGARDRRRCVAANVVADADDDAGEDGCRRRWAPCTLGIAYDGVAEDGLADAMSAGDDG